MLRLLVGCVKQQNKDMLKHNTILESHMFMDTMSFRIFLRLSDGIVWLLSKEMPRLNTLLLYCMLRGME